MSDKPLNHACFEVAMADILSQAYTAFPAPIFLDFKDAYDAAKAAGKIPAHCPASFTHYDTLYGSTLNFLVREGVVFAENVDPFTGEGIVLTSKGFLILNKPLDAIQQKTTIGEQLGKAGKKAGTEVLSSVVSQTIGLFIAQLSK